jgi:hypothetical protein
MLDDLVAATPAPSGPSYPSHQVLELACAAQRVNKAYIKYAEAVCDTEDPTKVLYVKTANKMLMLVTLDPKWWTGVPADQPFPLKVTQEDIDLATEIKSHYRKFMFSAVAGDNEFQTTVNSLLNSENIATNMFGFIACLPSLHVKDVMFTNVKRAAKKADEGWLGSIGDVLLDLDCEILAVQRSKNFDAWNIDATINNKLASWMSKIELKTGPCVVIKAKVKDTTKHWKHETPVTRLNFVKVAQ